MQTELLKVTGMNCDGCTGNVTKALRAIAGVSDVKVSLAAGEAERDLTKGHYIYDADLAPVADRLDRLFSGADTPQAAFLIEAIRKSDEIYDYYGAGERGEMPGYYSNNFVREEYMKTRCLGEYRMELAKDGKLPKGLM